MLSEHVSRYIELRRSLGFKFKLQACLLNHFVRFAESRGDTTVRNESVLAWAEEAPSVAQRRSRLLVVRRLSLSLQAEDARHEIPPADAFGRPTREHRTPHIYSQEDIRQLLDAAAQLGPKGSLRPTTHVALIALLASTGLRISEALALQLDDLTPGGLVIRSTKFRKSRLVPLHSTTRQGLERYMARRSQVASDDQSVFISMWGTGLAYSTVRAVFLELTRSAGLRRGGGEAVVWELAATLAPISKVRIRQPSEPPESVGDLCISPDGKWLVALWANKVDLWPIDAAQRANPDGDSRLWRLACL